MLFLSFFIIIGSVSATEDTINNMSTSIEDNSVEVSCVDKKDIVKLNVQTVDNNVSDNGKLVLADNTEDNCDKITEYHNISSASDLEHALNTGGNYSLTKNITIKDMGKSEGSEVCINGNGYTIHGNDEDYCDIDIEKSSACFMNCVFDKIRIDATSDVSLYNCTIQNTRTGHERWGAAITAEKSKVIVCNCSIVNCGAEDGYHGAVYLKYSRVNITNTSFENCFAAGEYDTGDFSDYYLAYGGAIHSEDTKLNLSNCVFKKCYASQGGGAVSISGGHAMVSNCVFKNDCSSGDGGAVYVKDGDNKIFNCSFIGCYANKVGSHGGAVYAYGPTSIINCNFTNCSAFECRESVLKGAIDRLNSDIYLKVANCLINGNNISIHNQADFESALNIGGNYTLANNITIDGVSKSDGLDVCINGNGYTIRGDDSKYSDIDVEKRRACFMNCIFYKVRIVASNDVSCYNCTFKDLRTGKYRYGAAISAEGCKVIMNNCSIINCGSHEGYHGAVYLNDCRATITNSYFENCFAADSWTCDDEGGAIFSKKSTLDLSNSVFKNCYARDDGGAVCTIDGNNRIFNCSFIGCHADSEGLYSSYGGAVYAEGSTSVIYCKFTNCHATGYKDDTWKRAIDRDGSGIDLKVSNCYIDDVLV